jgi:hypothetical protein
MSVMNFAQDPTTPQATQNLLEKIASESALHWYALYDSAFDPSPSSTPHEGVNCYSWTVMSDLERVGPRLISLHVREAPAEQIEQRLAAYIARCSSRPMLSFIASHEKPEDIAQHWSELHMVRTADRERYLLRIADTRTLPVLASVLAPEQWAAWIQPLKRWLLIDRSGALTELPWPDAAAAPATAPLALSTFQIERLTQAAEPDALIAFFEDAMPDMAPSPDEMQPSRWHASVAQALTLARQHGVERFEDKVAFLQATRLTSGACLLDKRVLGLLRSAAWTHGTLSKSLLATGVLD